MQGLQVISDAKFKGMNNRERPESLPEGYVVKALNCFLSNNEIEKGPGTTLATDYVGLEKGNLGAISTSSEIYFSSNNSGGTSANIYRWTGSGSATSIASMTADKYIEFVDTGNAVYAFNGTDTPLKLVGATVTTATGIPAGSFAVWTNNRLYVAGVSSYPNRFYYSDANDPDTFGGSSYIDIDPTLRSNILGLNEINGVVAIGKKDNILTFSGFTEDDFTVKSVTDEMPNFGVTSHRSMVNIGDDLLFMSFVGGTPHIRSINRTAFGDLSDGGIVSHSIEETMKGLNKDRLDIVAGGFDGRYAWWAVPNGISTTNNLLICYDVVEKEWTIHDDIEASVFFRSDISGQDRFYYGDYNEAKLYYFDFDKADRNGEDLTMEVESRVLRPTGGRKNKFKYLYLTTGSDTTGDLDIYGSPDGYTYELQGTRTPQVSDSSFPLTFPAGLGESTDQTEPRINLALKQAFTIQYKFTETSTQKVIIKEWHTYYYTRGLRG